MRKKNVESTIKRTKTILLNRHTYEILLKLRKSKQGFNLTEFVNKKLFELGGTELDLVKLNMFTLQQEMEDFMANYTKQLNLLVEQKKLLEQQKSVFDIPKYDFSYKKEENEKLKY